MNTEEVLSYVQQGAIQPGWQVYRALPGHFIRLLITYVVVAVLFIAGFFYMQQADFVIMPGAGGSGELDPGAFQLWRTIDLAVIGLAVVLMVACAIKMALDLRTVDQQFMVLTPEGVIIQEGKGPKALDFTAITALQPFIDRSGDATLTGLTANNQKRSLKFDKRYGKPKILVPAILQAHQQYQRARYAQVQQTQRPQPYQ